MASDTMRPQQEEIDTMEFPMNWLGRTGDSTGPWRVSDKTQLDYLVPTRTNTAAGSDASFIFTAAVSTSMCSSVHFSEA